MSEVYIFKLAFESCRIWGLLITPVSTSYLSLLYLCWPQGIFTCESIHPFSTGHFTFHVPWMGVHLCRIHEAFIFCAYIHAILSARKSLTPKLTFFLAWFIPTHIFKVSVYYWLGCLSIVFCLYQFCFLYCCIIVIITLNSLGTAVTSSICFHITDVPGTWELSVLNI